MRRLWIYRDRFGLSELYVADLDAIEGRPPQDRLVSSLAAFGALWLDGGVSSASRACEALTLGAAHVIVGLETLRSWDALAEICSVLDGVASIIVIDLARVGTGEGIDVRLIAGVRDAAPHTVLLAGGGVRGIDDLARLRDAGCDGALVATALHDGRIGVHEIAAACRHGSVSR